VPANFVHRPWRAPTSSRGYPPPVVDHAERRRLALLRFEEARRAALA
jgi:deoxyribodipyrimidine photolyase